LVFKRVRKVTRSFLKDIAVLSFPLILNPSAVKHQHPSAMISHVILGGAPHHFSAVPCQAGWLLRSQIFWMITDG